ncbi:hypothetical protein [Paenibacillus sp. MDMC362]|uniref:hypothetical protein n=1 Tax=Paenibacillus sp. MDMC362 TaxID=2977365 RepID=UPI000DC22C36|nr:hypothetical protein [Paenibacillus sp. MDMC362]RAR39613.1 hypothetical protein DP091_29815 [Paenibacillus sp. MDMC362]
MNRFVMILFLFLALVGCAGEQNTFHVEGPVEEINEQSSQIYVDGYWLPVKNIEIYNVGDIVSAEVESSAEGDQYVPGDIKVNKIKLKENLEK